jgi:uncharacterized protein (TIRG00374 family)
VWKVASTIDFRWVGLAMCFYAAALFCRIVRWKTVLSAVVPLYLSRVAVALLTGYAANAVLPARLGELFRADFCRREYGTPRSTVLGTIAIERLTDGIIVLTALLIGLIAVHTDANTTATLKSVMIAGVVLFGAAGLGLYLIGSDWSPALFAKVPRLSNHLNAFHASLQLLRKPKIFLVLLGSVIIWCFEGGALWAMLNACGVDLGVAQVCLVIGLVSLSTLLPSPPGFLGTMQFAFVIATTALGYSASQGLVAATATQLFLLIPMILVGSTLLTWRYVARTIATHKAERQSLAPQ